MRRPTQKRACQFVLLATTLLVTSAAPRADSGGNPTVIPRDANAYGASYAEWSARWMQWLLSQPASSFPLTGARCADGQAGPVWFLDAPSQNGTSVYDCRIPAGKALFVPILGVVAGAAVFDCEPTAPGVSCHLTTLRTFAAAAVDSVVLSARLDGTRLRNLRERQRVQSPAFTVTFPDDSLVGQPAGSYAPNVADGYYLLLAPLSAGRHTLIIKAMVTDGFAAGFEFEAIYNLTIEGRHGGWDDD